MTQNSFKMITSAISDRGLSEKRPQNEDSYVEMPERGLFAVADGVGGAQAGDVASQMAVEILAEAFNNAVEGGDLEELMNIAMSRANNAIYQMSHDLPQLSTMATTIVALQISGNIATIGHVGDSRLYRIDSKGNLFRETQDHSVVEEEVRAGRMTLEQAENHPSKNVISRALGAEGSVEIDMKTIMFDANSTFLLCSDGITRHISDGEIRELLALPHEPVFICQQMKDICYERGAEDNLTAVIVRVSGTEVFTPMDIEENTVASARPIANTADLANQLMMETGEIPTQNLEVPANAQFHQPQIIREPTITENAIVQPQPFSDTMQIPAKEEDSSNFRIEKDEKTYVINNGLSGGILSKIFPFLLGLILGGLVGAGAYFGWNSMQPPPEPAPQITKMQTPNIPYSAFEDSRRLVDNNPQKYIDASGAKADDAEDYYLLGRAYLLNAKYPEAKDVLGKAKAGLANYKGENKATLTNEIAIAVSAIENGFSIRMLEAEKSKGTVSSGEVGGSSPANTANVNK
jgi:protein phosphatase